MNKGNLQHIKFFVDPAWRHRDWQHIPLLFPFWGVAMDKERSPFGYAAFANHNFNTNCYSITDRLSEADMILMPYKYPVMMRFHPELYRECLAVSRREYKPLLVDVVGDIEYRIKDRGVFALRYGGYHFSKKSQDIIIPVYSEDLLERYCGGVLATRQKGAKPTIGFSGWSGMPLKQRVRAVIKELPTCLHAIFDDRYRACKKGVFWREKAIRRLRSSEKVICSFIARSTFSGHSQTMSGDPGVLRREFVQNILDNDYALDVRGDANASTRLFEILSLGRIPVIVDTERNFPFIDKINYEEFAVRVDFRNLHKLPDIIADFHEKISPQHFEDMQKAARQAYADHFCIDAIMYGVVRELRDKISKV